jgi:hypothetical protein
VRAPAMGADGARGVHRARMATLRTLPASALLLSSRVLMGEPVTVRHNEGLVHGFLALRTLDGSLLADGDLIQVARGNRVTSQIVFHFKDGSLHDETTVFTALPDSLRRSLANNHRTRRCGSSTGQRRPS